MNTLNALGTLVKFFEKNDCLKAYAGLPLATLGDKTP